VTGAGYIPSCQKKHFHPQISQTCPQRTEVQKVQEVQSRLWRDRFFSIGIGIGIGIVSHNGYIRMVLPGKSGCEILHVRNLQKNPFDTDSDTDSDEILQLQAINNEQLTTSTRLRQDYGGAGPPSNQTARQTSTSARRD